MKVFQILNNMCHWDASNNYKSAAEASLYFSPEIIFIDAPDFVFESWGYDETEIGDARFIKPTAPEGWEYDDKTGTFYPKPTLKAEQAKKIQESKNMLENYIAQNPLKSSAHGGKPELYTVTAEKQTQLASRFLMYDLATAAGGNYEITWNAMGKPCEIWTLEELTVLAFEIDAYVKSMVVEQQLIEEAVNTCTTVADVQAIKIDYVSKPYSTAHNAG